MRQQIAGMAIGLLLASAGGAEAAVWAWGCQGRLAAPDQTVIFTRFQMVLLNGKRPPLKPQDLLGEEALNPLIENARDAYDPNNINSGFQD